MKEETNISAQDQYADLLSKVKTMEPHLQLGGQFGGSTGPELFTKAIDAVRELAAEVGLKCD